MIGTLIAGLTCGIATFYGVGDDSGGAWTYVMPGFLLQNVSWD
jgi:hypothetical protein